MRRRPITTVAVALALLAAAPVAAQAQDPSPTATPTATPTVSPTSTPSAASADAKTDWPKDVQRVYDDYRRDGVIDVCKHTQKTLQDTLDTIQPAYDQQYPDFREALKAGISKWKAGGCQASATPTPTPSAAPGGSSGGGASGSPSSSGSSGSSSSSGASGVESGQLPHSAAHSGSGAVVPPRNVSPATTPVPTAVPLATPAPAVPAPVATPVAVVVNEGHGSLAAPAVAAALALLAAGGLGLWALLARRNPRLRHAWREAAFRTRGTWADFSDWLRLGR